MRKLVIEKLKKLYVYPKIKQYVDEDCVDSNGYKYNFNHVEHLGDVELLDLLIDLLKEKYK
jgi:hypothetical protein